MTAIDRPPTSEKWSARRSSARRTPDDHGPGALRGRHGRRGHALHGRGALAEAHARITSIDTSAAKALPGIHGVFTGADLDLASPLPMAGIPPGVEIKTPEHWPLAKDEVKYVGQGVAVVVGEDKYAVVDAAEQVLVDYDPLPVVVDLEKALEDGAALVHPEFGTNQVHGGRSAAAWTPPGPSPRS